MSLSYRRALKFLGLNVVSAAWGSAEVMGRRRRVRGGAVFEQLEAREMFSDTPPVVADFTKFEALHASAATFTFADFSAAFSDADNGDTLQTIEIDSLPTNGVLTVNGAAVSQGQTISATDIGTLTYTQTGNFTGTDTFLWNGSDGTDFALADANVTVSIPADTAPVLSDISETVLKNGNLTFTLADFTAGFSDADFGDSLQGIAITSLPANGTLSFNGAALTGDMEIAASDIGELTYAPTAGYEGADSFTWNATDGFKPAAADANVNLTVADTPPVVTNIAQTINKNGNLTFTLSDFTAGFSDADVGDSLQSITITGLPANGTLSFNGTALTGNMTIAAADIGELTYAPTAGYTGADSFTWNASDGFDPAAADATVNLTVTNTAPVVANVTLKVYGTPETFTLSDFTSAFTDADGDALSAIEITSLPVDVNGASAGNLTLNGAAVTVGETIQAADIPTLVFTPTGNFSGNATFQWNGSDGTALSAASANVTVTDVGVTLFPAAVVENRTRTFTEALFQTGYQDGDGGATLQTIEIVTLPQDGTLQLSGVDVTAGQTFAAADADNLTFVPNTNVTDAIDSFTWNGSDGVSFAATPGEVLVPINNLPPVASSSTIPVFETIATSLTAAEFTADFTDPDNEAPNPPNTDSLVQIEITTLPTHGTLELSGTAVTLDQVINTTDIGNMTYTPTTAGSTTGDSFQWLASDGKEFSNATLPATMTLNVALPTVTGISHLVTPNQVSTFALSEFTGAFTDTNPAATLQSIEILTLPSNGTLSLNGTAITANQVIASSDVGNMTFTPTAGFIGTATFTFKASDQGGFSASAATVSLEIDTPPTVSDFGKTEVVRGTSEPFILADFAANFTDTDTGNTLQAIKIVTLPTNGTLTLNGVAVTAGQTIQASKISQLVYKQTTGFTGNDTFTWEGSDGVAFSLAAGNVTITVPNTPPTVTPVSITTPENIAQTFTLADFTGSFIDPDTGSALASVTIVTLPAHGTLTLNGAAVTAGEVLAAIPPTDPSDPTTGMTVEQVIDTLIYTPTIGFAGTDTFTWNASDGTDLALNPSTVKATVTPPSFTQAETLHQSATIPLSQFTGIFSGNPGDTLQSVQITKLPANGTLALDNGLGGTPTAITLNQTIPVADLANIIYTQLPGFAGTDSFTWSGSNGTVVTLTGAKGIVTVPVDTAPTLTNFSATVAENATGAFAHLFTLADFSSSFTDPDSVTTGNATVSDSISSIKITALPKHGTLVLQGTAVTLGETITADEIGNVAYIPTTGFVGTDTFGWNASDSTTFAVNPATVTMTVAASTIGNVSLTTTPNTAITLTASDFSSQFQNADADTSSGSTPATDALASVKITSLPAHGKLTLGNVTVTANEVIAAASLATLTYTPTTNYHGKDSFGWEASDTFSGGTAFSAKASVNILNDNAPTLGTLNKAVTENIAKAFTLSDFTLNYFDANNDKLQSIEIATLPSNGTLTLSGLAVTAGQTISAGSISKLVYTPTAQQSGNAGFVDSFTWNASDGFQMAATAATATLNVNAPPVVKTVNKLVPPGTTLAFSASDFTSSFTDADTGDALVTIKFTTLPAHGTLLLNGVAVKQNQIIAAADLGNLTYTAKGTFVGNDTFQWNASDGKDFAARTASIVVALPPVFAVLGNGTPIVNKSTTPVVTTQTDFGSWTTQQDASMQNDVRTYTIQNFSAVTVTVPTITLSNSVDFTVTQPINTILAPNGTTTFTVQFNPTMVGKRTSIVTISATGNSPAFTFEIQGTAFHTTSMPTPTDADDTITTGVVQVGSNGGGSGVGASNGQIIAMIYTGYLTDGTIFDSTTIEGGAPLTFRLDDQFQTVGSSTTQQPYINSDQTGGFNGVDFSVIPGWEYGLQGITVGEKRTLIINSAAGYGASGQGTIPGGATLVFDVQCVSLSGTKQQLGVESVDSSGNATAYILPGQTSISANDNTLFTISPGSSVTQQSFQLLTSGTNDITGASVGSWTFKGRVIGLTGDTKDFSIGLNGRTVQITFHPLSTGTKTAEVHILTNDPLHPDFTFEIQGISPTYSDMIVEYNVLKFPVAAVTAGSSQTVSLPVVLKNIGDSSVPSGSKTNVQIYAENVSTDTLTLIKTINNVDISGLGANGLKFMTTSLTMPANLASGGYVFETEVNESKTESESATDPTLATYPEAASSNNTATTSSGIGVVQGVYHVTGNLGTSTLLSSASGVSGNLTISLKNTGSISLPSGEQATVQIIARPLGATDSSTDVMLESGAAAGVISISQLGSGSKSYTIPVSFGLPLASGQYSIIVLVTPAQPLTDNSLVTLDADGKGNSVMLTSTNG